MRSTAAIVLSSMCLSIGSKLASRRRLAVLVARGVPVMMRAIRLTVSCNLSLAPGDIRGPQTLDPYVKMGMTCERHAARMSPVLPPHLLPEILLMSDSFLLAFMMASLQ